MKFWHLVVAGIIGGAAFAVGSRIAEKMFLDPK